MADILTSTRWGAMKSIRAMREAGFTVKADVDTSALQIPCMNAGEEIVGPLPEELTSLLAELIDLHKEYSSAHEDVAHHNKDAASQALALRALAEMVENSVDLSSLSERTDLPNIGAVHKMFAIDQRRKMVHATFHYILGDTFNLHHWCLGVRRNAAGEIVVVKTQLRPAE